jgi:uncharacterized protein (TIRG00374 family)
MANEKKQGRAKLSARRGIGLLIFLLFLYVLLPQLKKFRGSLGLLDHVNLFWLGLAFVASWVTYLAAGATYWFLSKKRLNYKKTVLVQIAGNFANKLLPAGSGAIGTNYDYLRKNAHTKTQAAVVVAVNNITGIVGHLIILSSILIFARDVKNPFSRIHVHVSEKDVVVVAAVVVIIVALGIFVWLKKARRKVFSLVAGIARDVRSYHNRPARLIGVLLSAISLTLLYALTLHACVEAVGVNVPIPDVIIILTFGIAGGTLIPTPGGLGGAEAGLLAGLVAYNVSSGDALVIVLLYRLLTYWLAIATGFIAFFVCGQLDYI